MHKYLGFVLSMLCAPSLGAQTQQHKFQLMLGTGLSFNAIPNQSSADIALQGVIPKMPLEVFETLDLQFELRAQYAFAKWLYAGLSFQQSIILLPSKDINENRRHSFTMLDGSTADFYVTNNIKFTTIRPGIAIDILPNNDDENLFLEVGLNLTYTSFKPRFLTEIEVADEYWNNFVGSGTEIYKRNGWALSWQMDMRWVDYFSENWGYSLYFNYQPLTFRPQKMELTMYELNGEELTNTLTTRQRAYNFGNPESDNPQNPNAPTELTEEKYVFRGFVLGFGVNYRF